MTDYNPLTPAEFEAIKIKISKFKRGDNPQNLWRDMEAVWSDLIRVTEYAALERQASKADHGRDTRLVEMGNALANVQRLIEQERKR